MATATIHPATVTIHPARVRETRELLKDIKVGDKFAYPSLIPAFEGSVEMECLQIVKDTQYEMDVTFCGTRIGLAVIEVLPEGGLTALMGVK